MYLIWMHALHYTKPYEQRQYVGAHPEPDFQLLTAPKHYQNSVHDTDLCRGFLPILLVLLARDLLGGHIRLLRGLCDCVFLCTPLSLHRT